MAFANSDIPLACMPSWLFTRWFSSMPSAQGQACGRLRSSGSHRIIADDIAQLLVHLGAERATICGVSFGGVIAQHFAARHPERVERLVVVDSYSDTRPTTVGKALWLASVYAGSISNLLPSAILANVMRGQYRRWPHAAGHLADVVTRLRPFDALKTQCAINLVNYPPALNAANYPILGVVGEDSWPRSITFMEELQRAVPRTRLIRVAESNDPTPLCQPAAFNAILADFLRD